MAARSEENCMSPFRWGDGRVVDYNEISSPSSRGISPCKKLESGDFINGECKNIQQQTPNKTRGTLKRRFSYTCINSRSSSSRSRSSRGNSEENKLRDEPFREKRTRCYSNTSSTGSIETDAIVLARRQKQIDYGKNTAAYDNYIDTVPKSKRTREHPHTPDKYRKYSRRAFDGLIKIWRRQLHVYDPPNLHESTDTDSDTN